MGKPAKIQVEGKEYYAWRYEEQTQIKHRVLDSYSRIWIAKLGSKCNTIFFDCHGGCGAYINDDGSVGFGSSIIVRKAANEVNKNRSSKTGIIYCEVDKNNHDNFIKVLIDNGSPKILHYNKAFEDIIKETNIKKYYTQNPTLFFVDPFGFNFNIDILPPLMKSFGNEIIVNFMFDFINRFIAIPSLEVNYNQFFGCSEWKQALNLKEKEREDFLVGLYKNRLKVVTGAKYVFPYRLCYPNKDQTYYYLFHATNHIDGITHMKEAFARINNGRVEYLGKNQNTLSFFDLTFFKSDNIYQSCLLPLRGTSITFTELWERIVEDVAYTSKDLNEALKELQDSGKVNVERVTSKRCSYKEKDIITVL